MKIFVTFLIIFLLLGTVIGVRTFGPEKRTDTTRSTYIIASQKQAGERQLTSIVGMGVLVSDDGKILTANHIIAPIDQTYRVFSLQAKKWYDAQVLARNSEKDLGVLQIEKKANISFIPATTGSIKKDKKVSILGMKKGTNEIQKLSGSLIQETGEKIETDIGFEPGYSGGGLFASDGTLIGINVSQKELKSISIKVNTNTVKDLLLEQ